MGAGSKRINYIPFKWREVKVIFISKAGKASHVNPNDFRPISLSSFILKTIERLLDMYIRQAINKSLLSDSQHAYYKGKSTEIALHSIVSKIEKSLYYKEYTLIAFSIRLQSICGNLPCMITATSTAYAITL